MIRGVSDRPLSRHRSIKDLAPLLWDDAGNVVRLLDKPFLKIDVQSPSEY
jgi:hypothetical protein